MNRCFILLAGCLFAAVLCAADGLDLDADLPPSGGVKNSAFGAWPFVQVPDETYDVNVLRMNIPIGKHRSFTGLDIGLLANVIDGRQSGVAFATVGNMAGRSEALLQIAAAFNYVDRPSSGFQFGCVNVTGDDYAGPQLGIVNLTGLIGGFQLGVYNQAERVDGVQIGVLNVAGELAGLQFGLLNIASASSVPVLPLLHIGY